MKLKMLQPRLATLDPWKARGLKTVEDLKKNKPWLKLEDIKTARWTKANNGRLIPLNSAAWRKLRASVLAEEPLCRMCKAQGKVVIATDVDHINNDPSDNRRESLQSLCHSCHSLKTASDMGHNVRMGCAMDGTPLDPQSHWNKPTGAVLVGRVSAVDEISPATDEIKPAGLSSFNANPSK